MQGQEVGRVIGFKGQEGARMREWEGTMVGGQKSKRAQG